jgi:hypothetical protein
MTSKITHWKPLTTLALVASLSACGGDDTTGDTTDTTDPTAGTDTDGPTTDPTDPTDPTTPGTTTGPTTDDDTHGDDTHGDDTEGDETGEPAGESDIRIIHLSPDAPGVDIFLDPGAPAAIENLEFPDGTPFVTVPEGSYDIRVSAAGAGADDPVISVDGFAIPADGKFTVAAFGELSNIDLMVVAEDDDGIEAGTLRAFVGHAADGVGTVDVWAIGLADDPVEVLPGFAYGDWDPLDIPADTAFSVGLDADSDGVPDFVFPIPGLPEGITLSLFAVLDSEGPFLIAYLPDGSAAGPIRPE